MSSMRNAAPRRPHRERSQPQARAKWGLLEKHKDYSLRAADYNQKKKKLKILSEKSREKNPDEFAFGMLSADKAKAGKHGRADRQKNKLDHNIVEALKQQDAGYLRTMLGTTRKELGRVKEDIAIDSILKRAIGAVGEEKKIYFDADGQPLRKKRKIDVSEDEWSDEDTNSERSQGEDMIFEMDEDNDKTVPDDVAVISVQNTAHIDDASLVIDDLIGRDESDDEKPRNNVLTKKQQQRQADELARRKLEKRRRKRAREARENKLDILRKRQKSIMAAADELELQRAKMAGTVGGTNKNGVKFKIRERKK